MKRRSRKERVFAGFIIAAISFLPAAAFARESGDSGALSPVSISAHIEAEGDGVSADASTTAGMHEGDENDNSDDNSQSDEASSTKHRQDERQSADSNHESDESDNEIEIDHDSADNATTTIDAPERVSNHGELRSFLNHIVKEDDRISDVHVSSSTIETHYKMPAKFLWAIPADLTADVSVNSDGSVSVTYPWYSFLFATHGSELAAQLEQSTASTTAGTTTLSASAQAHLLNLLFSSLKISAE